MENVLSATLIIGLLFTCCGVSGFSESKDCGVDGYECLAEAAEDGCAPARTILAGDVPMEASITGSQDPYSCDIGIRALSKDEMYDLFRAEGADERTIQLYDEAYGVSYSAIGNKEASCLVERDYVYNFLRYGQFDSYCSGELMDHID